MADDLNLQEAPSDAMDQPSPDPVADVSAPPVLIDYRGDGEVPSHAVAPLAMRASGELLVVFAGLNRVDGAVWEMLQGHPGADRFAIGVSIPRQLSDLLPLIDRTWALSGLDAIADAEGARPRPKVAAALHKQRSRVQKRCKPAE